MEPPVFKKQGDLPERPAWIEDENGCFIWNGAFQGNGYGCWTRTRGVGGTNLAHRRVYEMVRGPIPAGLQLDHLCRVRACVNPDHLEPVSARTNLMRGKTHAAANAAKTTCPSGHVYDDENTYVTRRGQRICRMCARLRMRERRALQREVVHA